MVLLPVTLVGYRLPPPHAVPVWFDYDFGSDALSSRFGSVTLRLRLPYTHVYGCYLCVCAGSRLHCRCLRFYGYVVQFTRRVCLHTRAYGCGCYRLYLRFTLRFVRLRTAYVTHGCLPFTCCHHAFSVARLPAFTLLVRLRLVAHTLHARSQLVARAVPHLGYFTAVTGSAYCRLPYSYGLHLPLLPLQFCYLPRFWLGHTTTPCCWLHATGYTHTRLHTTRTVHGLRGYTVCVTHTRFIRSAFPLPFGSAAFTFLRLLYLHHTYWIAILVGLVWLFCYARFAHTRNTRIYAHARRGCGCCLHTTRFRLVHVTTCGCGYAVRLRAHRTRTPLPFTTVRRVTSSHLYLHGYTTGSALPAIFTHTQFCVPHAIYHRTYVAVAVAVRIYGSGYTFGLRLLPFYLVATRFTRVYRTAHACWFLRIRTPFTRTHVWLHTHARLPRTARLRVPRGLPATFGWFWMRLPTAVATHLRFGSRFAATVTGCSHIPFAVVLCVQFGYIYLCRYVTRGYCTLHTCHTHVICLPRTTTAVGCTLLPIACSTLRSGLVTCYPRSPPVHCGYAYRTGCTRSYATSSTVLVPYGYAAGCYITVRYHHVILVRGSVRVRFFTFVRLPRVPFVPFTHYTRTCHGSAVLPVRLRSRFCRFTTQFLCGLPFYGYRLPGYRYVVTRLRSACPFAFWLILLRITGACYHVTLHVHLPARYLCRLVPDAVTHATPALRTHAVGSVAHAVRCLHAPPLPHLPLPTCRYLPYRGSTSSFTTVPRGSATLLHGCRTPRSLRLLPHVTLPLPLRLWITVCGYAVYLVGYLRLPAVPPRGLFARVVDTAVAHTRGYYSSPFHTFHRYRTPYAFVGYVLPLCGYRLHTHVGSGYLPVYLPFGLFVVPIPLVHICCCLPLPAHILDWFAHILPLRLRLRLPLRCCRWIRVWLFTAVICLYTFTTHVTVRRTFTVTPAGLPAVLRFFVPPAFPAVYRVRLVYTAHLPDTALYQLPVWFRLPGCLWLRLRFGSLFPVTVAVTDAVLPHRGYRLLRLVTVAFPVATPRLRLRYAGLVTHVYVYRTQFVAARLRRFTHTPVTLRVARLVYAYCCTFGSRFTHFCRCGCVLPRR